MLKSYRRIVVLCLIIMLVSSVFVFNGNLQSGASERGEINLIGSGWKLWRDTNAQWQNDTLYLPNQINLSTMPINAPTDGWNSMYDTKGKNISIPANVEEYFGNGVNSYTYRGVSWFWTTVNIPSNWQGKTVRIKVEKTRLRAEIYVNEKLAGYDIISETPYEFDISKYINYGENNKIAIRITNPGGERGWHDYTLVHWGSYRFPAGKDFGGIGGEVKLVATDNTYVGDVFVKNLLPANSKKVEINASIHNKQTKDLPLDMTVRIIPYKGGNPIFTQTYQVTANRYQTNTKGYTTTEVSKTITVSDAKLWDIDDPNLYYAEVSINSQDGTSDTARYKFGFRTFEVKHVGSMHNLYFNDKRIRHRSAIDWGFYAQGGNYTTDEMARKSVQAAKDLGQNGINFHRQLGESLVLKYADELGLYMYQEVGSFHVNQGENMTAHPFAVDVMKEKVTRMVLRDRNNPSLIWYNLANEDNANNNQARMWALEEIAKLDGTRMVTNSSGDNNPTVGSIKHIRPYETQIRNEFMDHHTVNNTARFDDRFVRTLNKSTDTRVLYWGESGCYVGPSNWYKVAHSQNNLDAGRKIYDLNIFQPLHDKILKYFNDNDLANTGSGNIKSPGDVSVQAGRGLMYSVGRLGQFTMIMNNSDGYAINGWSSGPLLPYQGHIHSWDSAMLDEGRNIKGPAEDYAFWVRDLQLAVRRMNGKYFDVGDTATFEVYLINEGKLPAGDYTIKVRAKDGDGKYTSYLHEESIKVEGGDTHAQFIIHRLFLKFEENWKGGYISLDARLYDKDGKEVANGAEQVVLKNRPSYKKDLFGLNGAVLNWSPAKTAITDAGVQVNDYSSSIKDLDYIAVGTAPSSTVLDEILKKVHDDGTFLLVRFDTQWANLLNNKGILSTAVTKWGGVQTNTWYGNGFGYLDHFIGDQAIPSGKTISTNSWEVPSDPTGFYPFESNYKTKAYGAYFARHDELLVLMGTIDYGKGKILLSPGYKVDENNAFNDMLFYNLISMNTESEDYAEIEAEQAVTAFENAPITTMDEIESAQALKAIANEKVELLADGSVKQALEARIATKKAEIDAVIAEDIINKEIAQAAVEAYETAPISTSEEILAAELLEVEAKAKVVLVLDAEAKAGFGARIATKKVEVDAAKQTINPPSYGDINDDGQITNVDLILLKRYIAGITVDSINQDAADVNGDGKITNVDLILLNRYLAGIINNLGPQ